MGSFQEALRLKDNGFAKICGYSTVVDTAQSHLSQIFRQTPDFRAGNISEDFQVACQLKIAIPGNDVTEEVLCYVEQNGGDCPIANLPVDKIPINLVHEIHMARILDRLDRQKIKKQPKIITFFKKLFRINS